MPSSALALLHSPSFPTRRSSDLAAIVDYTAAIRLDPSLAAAYNGRGLAYLNRQQNQAALSDFEAAVQLSPDWANPYVSRGLAHARDRKSTRLNSSHRCISYAVFCSRAPPLPLFPYTTLFRSCGNRRLHGGNSTRS